MLSFVTSAPSQPDAGYTSDDAGDEPFGQAGLRQHFGRWLAALCLVGALLTGAMWYRSTFFFDNFEWRGKGQSIHIRSIHERLLIDYAADPSRAGLGGAGWTYNGGFTKRVQDGWPESIWKTIGIEYSPQPLNRNSATGFWLRVKWQFIVVVMILVPTSRGIYLIWCRRREREE